MYPDFTWWTQKFLHELMIYITTQRTTLWTKDLPYQSMTGCLKHQLWLHEPRIYFMNQRRKCLLYKARNYLAHGRFNNRNSGFTLRTMWLCAHQESGCWAWVAPVSVCHGVCYDWFPSDSQVNSHSIGWPWSAMFFTLQVQNQIGSNPK